MDLHGAVAVVTGAGHALGPHLVSELREHGARKVYATSRAPGVPAVPGVLPLRLDVTDPDAIAASAAIASDATLLINNAEIRTGTSLVDGDLRLVDLEMETNFYGSLGMIRAFAPIIAANGGGAILNVLTARPWQHDPAASGAYRASKAAARAMTEVARSELAPRGVQVAALCVVLRDPGRRAPDPARVAAIALDGLAAGMTEIVADERLISAAA
jgi:NAD(P)-dependent dehydrogenase (short-subunit alcohol dehydrogenase family)